MKTNPELEAVAPHIRASWSKEERAFFEAVLSAPLALGPEWTTGRRRIEMQEADIDRRNFFLSYWPQEALKDLELFKRDHFDALPTEGAYATSSITERVEFHYPYLFKFLDARMAPLGDTLDTHPHLAGYWNGYSELKASYWRKLTAAEELTADVESATRRFAKRHELYMMAFEAAYPRLHELLNELDMMLRR